MKTAWTKKTRPTQEHQTEASTPQPSWQEPSNSLTWQLLHPKQTKFWKRVVREKHKKARGMISQA
ncbi:hypothetical protein J7E73_08190 [Paenibacillus albidus]|uniref:hypothetical protein n=1 Tax=Paenibacillus albidus TaxID=2041023 RepID=UPI001BE755DA|nr:hypothetical protein [Paenibacillus albidus]MBT2289112.1 hypothetical protein [Paenibacillus albidus]